jgi:hypothetical protein
LSVLNRCLAAVETETNKRPHKKINREHCHKKTNSKIT